LKSCEGKIYPFIPEILVRPKIFVRRWKAVPDKISVSKTIFRR